MTQSIPLLHRCAEKKYPEALPTISVVLIYLNEALSIIQRAIRSIIDRTPAELLVEIILVDDHSTNGGWGSSPFSGIFHNIALREDLMTEDLTTN